MIENRRSHGANAFRNSGIDENALVAGFRHPALHLPALRVRKLRQQLLDPLSIRVEGKVEMPLCGIERKHRSQADVKLHQFRLRLANAHYNRAVPGPQRENGCFLRFFRELRKVAFRQLDDLRPAYGSRAKLNQQRSQRVGALAFRTQKTGAGQRCKIAVRGGPAQVKRGSHLADFHLVSAAGEHFQNARESIDDLYIGSASNDSLFDALPFWLWRSGHSRFARCCPHCGTSNGSHRLKGCQPMAGVGPNSFRLTAREGSGMPDHLIAAVLRSAALMQYNSSHFDDHG